MKILLLTAYFPPDTGSAAHLFYELGTHLVTRGHQVTVITNLPGYHAQGDLERYRRKLVHKEEVNGMRVVRVTSLRLPPRLMIGRALWQFTMSFTFWLAALLLPRHQVALLYSPPLTLGLAAWGLRLFRRTPFILNVQDLFPQSIIDLGLLTNPTLIRFFESLERFVYRQADRITVHSSGNQDHVLSKGASSSKVQVLHNWVDTDFIQPGERLNPFTHQYHLADRFVVSFAGVIGYSQDLDVVLGAADILRPYPEIAWVIVGDGVEKDRLAQKARQMGLDSVIFVPMQSREHYPAVLHASHLGLATLHTDVKTPVIPSKILSIMAAGQPVIAAMDLSGDAPKLIAQAQCGYCLSPGDAQALADAVLELYRDPGLRQTMGQNGRRYAQEHFSLTACLGAYEALFSAFLQKKQNHSS